MLLASTYAIYLYFVACTGTKDYEQDNSPEGRTDRQEGRQTNKQTNKRSLYYLCWNFGRAFHCIGLMHTTALHNVVYRGVIQA